MPCGVSPTQQMNYGTGKLELSLPPEALSGAYGLASMPVKSAQTPNDVLRQAIVELHAAGFEEACAGKRLGLLVADGSRAWDPEMLIAPLGNSLRAAARVDVVLCTGTHDPSGANHLDMARRVGASLELAGVSANVHIHAAERDVHRLHGHTERGTRVEIYDGLDRWDALLVLSDMKHHYFAGYSNPIKYVLPGLAAIETARGNHSLAMQPDSRFGQHPWHPQVAQRSNPLAEDMLEAFQMVLQARPAFALTTITGAQHVLRWAAGGRAREASARGMQALDEMSSLSLPASRFLVVSAGGAPHDDSLYTVQRALEMSERAVERGGEVLFLAACPDGVGSELARRNFYEPLCAPLESIRAPAREEYTLYSHKPVKFARLIKRLAKLHLVSEFAPSEVRAMHMHPCAHPQALIDEWVARLDPGEGIQFLDDASKIAIR